MLTLYYFPGACSMSAHMALEETETAYERKSVNLRAGEQNGEAFRRINPRGEVPVLSVGDKVIMPGVIDAASHIGIEANDLNEPTDPMTPNDARYPNIF